MHVRVHILYHVRQPLEFSQSEVTDVGTVAKEKSGDLGETGETGETVSLAGRALMITEASSPTFTRATTLRISYSSFRSP